jgi:hypothetical protein
VSQSPANMRRRLIHFLCGFLLLAAQHGALMHATWHAGTGALAHKHAQAANHQSPDDHGRQGNLCAFDLAFGQVLGGVHGSCAQPLTAELPAAVANNAVNPRSGSEAVPALSRGPPVLL